LSDDELVLCDAMFSNRTPVGVLMHDDFRLAFNLGYGHQIDEASFPGVLESMKRRDIIQGGEGAFGPYVELTRAGGALWESERLPVWDAYCDTASQKDGRGGTVLIVQGMHVEVIEAFLRVAAEAGLYGAVVGSVAIEPGAPARSVRWKGLATVTARATAAGEHHQQVDWVTYESQRTWWRTVPELLRSHRAAPDTILGDGWPPPLFGSA